MKKFFITEEQLQQVYAIMLETPAKYSVAAMQVLETVSKTQEISEPEEVNLTN